VSWDSAFDEFTQDSVTWEKCIGPGSGFGDRAFDPVSKTVRCRIEQGARLVRDAQGREVVSQTRLFLRPTAEDGSAFTPGVNDRFTLPSGYVPQQPPIISAGRHNDADGLHHYEVAL